VNCRNDKSPFLEMHDNDLQASYLAGALGWRSSLETESRGPLSPLVLVGDRQSEVTVPGAPRPFRALP
jgi:hypothetical protein